MKYFRLAGTLILILLVLSGCGSLSVITPNKQHRTEIDIVDCKIKGSENCGKSIIEEYGNFSATYVEFTERGNLFDRDAFREVVSYIENSAKKKSGVAVVVFVHGWKHSASEDDSHVKQYIQMLDDFSNNNLVGERKLVGLYVGWRGSSITLPGVRQLTFWDRKSVAEEVGDGGVTEVLSRVKFILEPIKSGNKIQGIFEPNNKIDSSTRPDKNSLIIIGHSFGGAVVLSALHDVLLSQLVSAYDPDSAKGSTESEKCNVTPRFADAIILINPAIEANRILQLKEVASGCQFSKKQPKILHILSTDGDFPTRIAFPLGQYLGTVIPWDQEEFSRTIDGKNIVMSERHLDTQTIGNLQQFRTGYLSESSEQENKWIYTKCPNSYENTRASLEECGVTDLYAKKNHFQSANYNPLSFIGTDSNFMHDHGDVFNCKVKSYFATIALESRSYGAEKKLTKTKSEACYKTPFDFGACFEEQLEEFKALGCR